MNRSINEADERARQLVKEGKLIGPFGLAPVRQAEDFGAPPPPEPRTYKLSDAEDRRQLHADALELMKAEPGLTLLAAADRLVLAGVRSEEEARERAREQRDALVRAAILSAMKRGVPFVKAAHAAGVKL